MHILRRLLFFLSLSLVAVAASAPGRAQAQQLAPATITDVQVTTVDGKAVKDTPLMAGATYKVSFVIEAAPGLKEKAVLKTSLVRAPGSDRFWTLKGTYPGIDAATWQPGASTISFDAVAGKAQLQLEGSVPQDYVSGTSPDGQALHAAKEIALLELSLPSGPVVGALKIEVIDSTIEEFRSVLSAKTQLVAGMNADQSFIKMAQAVVASAEAQAKVGYTDSALNSLKSIPTSGWAAPRASTSYLWIIIAALAVIAAGLSFLLIRARNETGFVKRQTDGQAKRLQILALKASRIGDSSLTDGIEQVRKELEQSAGGS
jgi:hypothetical protein